MNKLLKKLALLLALVATCAAFTACSDDDDDKTTDVVGSWEMVNQLMVSIDDKGEISKEEMHRFGSSVWVFGDDGTQYVIYDNKPEEGSLYRYEIKGNKITFTQQVENNPEIMEGIVTTQNNVMTLDVFVYGKDNKNEYIEYIFQLKK